MNENQQLQTTTGGGFLRPVVSINEALQAYQTKKELIDRIFHEGVDYGKIPGAGDKKVLLKAGAEKARGFFGIQVTFDDVEIIEDWTGEHHGGEPFFYYRTKATAWTFDGHKICDAGGSCNSWEKKYRYRQAERVCPECGHPAIKRSKYAPKNKRLGNEPGWYCFDKAGGCGQEFAVNDPEIVNQQLGLVPNPDISDVVNTVLKQSHKRSLVAVTLLATGLSDYFTQDMEDFITVEAEPFVASVETEPSPVTPAKPKARKTAEPVVTTPPQPTPPLLWWSRAVSYARGKGLSEDEAIQYLSEMGLSSTADPGDAVRVQAKEYIDEIAARKKATVEAPVVATINPDAGFPAKGEDLAEMVGTSSDWLLKLKPLVLGTLQMGNKRAVSMWKHMDEDAAFSEQTVPSIESLQAVCDAVAAAIKE